MASARIAARPPAAGATLAEDRLHILMCVGLFYPAVGGVERQVQVLARTLVRQGHAVEVVTQRLRGRPAREVIDGIVVRRQTRTVSLGPLFGVSYLLSLGGSLLRHRRRYQIVHVHQLYLDAAAAGILRGILRRPVVVTLGAAGHVGDVARLKATAFSSLFFQATRRCDRLVAITGPIEQELIAHEYDPRRIVRIPYGVDTERFHPTGDREAAKARMGLRGRVVSYVGRFAPEKRLSDLIRAWCFVAGSDPNALLLLVGAGPEERSLRTLVAREGLHNRVIFVGAQDDVLICYQASDVFVLPSEMEGMPNVLLEAMATAVPCVATNVGGIPEVITDGVNGLLVQPRNPAELAAAIFRLLRDEGLARRLGAAARQVVEREYNIERVADRYVNLYRELLQEEAHAAFRA